MDGTYYPLSVLRTYRVPHVPSVASVIVRGRTACLGAHAGQSTLCLCVQTPRRWGHEAANWQRGMREKARDQAMRKQTTDVDDAGRPRHSQSVRQSGSHQSRSPCLCLRAPFLGRAPARVERPCGGRCRAGAGAGAGAASAGAGWRCRLEVTGCARAGDGLRDWVTRLN